jgi:cobalt-zinc-cadmium efflux system protein
MKHSHGHADSCSQEKDRRRLLYAAGLTGVILVVEALGGYFSHSLSLLSDSGHMMTDLLALLLSLFAMTVASRPATHRKTYGFYRLEILTALVNGTILILISLYLVYEAVRRMLHPETVATSLMLSVAVVGLIANLAGIALLSGSRRNLNVRAALLHVLGDALSSLGVIGAALIMKFTLWYQADGLISLIISGVILWGAVRLMREACDILLEATPSGVALLDLSRAIRSVEGVVDLHDLHVWSITSGMPALSGHVVVEDTFLAESDHLLNRIKRVLEERFGICHTTLQLESERYVEVGEVHLQENG